MLCYTLKGRISKVQWEDLWKLPNGQPILTFTFLVVKLWELPADEIRQTGLVGLLPLLPLTRDGTRHEVIDGMIEEIVAAKQYHLLTLGEIVAGLVFKEEQDQAWLKGRFAMHQDILEESWVYQEIMGKGLEKGIEQGVQQGIEQAVEQERQRQVQAFVSIVQGRFPELMERAKKRASEMTTPTQLQQLLISIGLAKDIEEARLALRNGSTH